MTDFLNTTFPLILGTSLAAVMGVALISPALPVIQSEFALTDPQTGYLITAYTLPAVILAPIAGILSDRFGRKIILVPSLILFGVAGLSISVSSSFKAILVLRFIQGIGGTALALLSRTLIGDFYEPGTQNTVMGLNDATIAFGTAVFPFIGGYLAGYQWSNPFLLYGFALVIGGLVYFKLPRINLSTKKADDHHYLTGFFKAVPFSTGLIGFTGIFGLFFLLYGAIHTSIPLLLNRQFKMSSGDIGIYMSLMAICIVVVSSSNGRLSNIFSTRALSTTGFGFYGLGLGIIGATNTSFLALIGMISVGIGHGLALPSLNTLLVSSVPVDYRGGVMSVRTLMARLGQTFGPLMFPVMATISSYETVFFWIGIFTVLTAIVIFTFSRPLFA